MSHYAVLRHTYDVHRNPDRLGGGARPDEAFWLELAGGAKPTHLAGGVLWLICWDGFPRPHHSACGWFNVSRVGTKPAVVSHHCVGGSEGSLFAGPVGPLDRHAWFTRFVEAHKSFRDGEPTDATEIQEELINLVRAAGCQTPPVAAWDQVVHGPAAM